MSKANNDGYIEKPCGVSAAIGSTENLRFRCTNMDADPQFNFGLNPCGRAVSVDGVYLCGDKNGRYAPDYTYERCGAAVPRQVL